MSKVPPDSKVLRQLLVVGLLAFLIGMAAVLLLIGWLMWRFAEPDTPWYDMLHVGINGLLISVLGGLALAAGAINLLSWWHDRKELHRCSSRSWPSSTQ